MERHCFPTNFVMNLKGARESTSVRPVFLCRPMKGGRKGGNAAKGIFYENCFCWHAGEEEAAPEEWEIGGREQKVFPSFFAFLPLSPSFSPFFFVPPSQTFPRVRTDKKEEGDGWGKEGDRHCY